MAGHSKWANIQHRKGRQDEKRGKAWTRVIREIMVAARLGGGDVSANPRLRLAVEKAKAVNLPVETVKRNIDKATGNLEGVNYEEIRYEGYGIGGAAIIVDCMTDNRVRTVAEVRHAFSKYGGNMGTEGSVAFQFKHCGQLIFAPGTSEDKVMEIALDAGADDVIAGDDGSIEVLTPPTEFEAVKNALEAGGPEGRIRRGDDAGREPGRDRRRGRAAHAETARRDRGTRRRAGRLSQRGDGRVKVLVIGGGGREHALAWKLAQSPKVQCVYVAPGNGGTATDPALRNLPITDLAALADFAAAEKIGLTVVGPEAPLAAGVVDLFRARGLRIFGADARRCAARELEGLRQGFHAAARHPDRALRQLHRRRRGARACRRGTVRRS